MAGLSTAGKNLALDSGIGGFAYASLHSANAVGTGANELSGGSPAYARVQITWGDADGATKSNTNEIVFNVPGGASVAEVGYWSAASGGIFYGSRSVTFESFSGQGTYTIAVGGIQESAA